MPNGPAVEAEASAQLSSGDTHMNEIDSRLVRPRNLFNSGRWSKCDTSRHDRPLTLDSTGRQCPDLHEKDESESVIDEAGPLKDHAADDITMHVVNVGTNDIDTPHKDVSFSSNYGFIIPRESRPPTIGSGRQSPFIFDSTRLDRPQPERY